MTMKDYYEYLKGKEKTDERRNQGTTKRKRRTNKSGESGESGESESTTK